MASVMMVNMEFSIIVMNLTMIMVIVMLQEMMGDHQMVEMMVVKMRRVCNCQLVRP